MYIPENFNHILWADRSPIESNQVIDSDLSQSCTHLTNKSKFLQSSVFGKLSSLSITTHSNGILSCHQLLSVNTFYFKVHIHLQVLKRCFASPGSAHRDLFKPPIGVKHQSDNTVHISPGYHSLASNSSACVITPSYSEWTKCHSSGYINSTPFGHKSYKSCLPTSQQLKNLQRLGRKTSNGLKAFLVQMNYTSYYGWRFRSKD